ncbi:MAG: hypothetical protein CSA38_05110 [Flavobacteriales bacterium]|nr:MAG: hypothetical protein CSA38_05110 [Flavobacteriales bacterium]
MKRIIPIVLSLFVVSCNNEKVDKDKTVSTDKIIQHHDYTNMVLYDTIQKELVLDTLSNGEIADFPILYIGKIKDSIKLKRGDFDDYSYSYEEFARTQNHEELPPPLNKYPYPYQKNQISIFIDTTKTVGFYEYDSPIGIKSYPVFIENLSQDTLYIANNGSLPMLTEMKSNSEDWKEIEKPFLLMCGVGIRHDFLPPNQIVITTLRQNYGTTKVKYRLKLKCFDKNFYSNEINGKFQTKLK